VSYLQCTDCRLTVPAAAYYLRGDQCPRCLARMEKRATFRRVTPRAQNDAAGARGTIADALPLAPRDPAASPPSPAG
jgi:hypothetical protein